MRYWLAVFLFGALFWGVSSAQSDNPEWFVLDSRTELVEDEVKNDAEVEIAPKEETSLPESFLSLSIFSDEGFEDNLRFAKNNRDLELAGQWLKQEFKNEKTKNIVLSPLDFYLSSVLLANGVVDQSLFEFSKMFSVMRLAEVNQQIKSYVAKRNPATSIQLSLWGKTFSEHFSELMKEQLNVEIWGLKDTTDIINDWIKAKTDGEIDQIISKENVDEKDVFLVSSASFEACWWMPFDFSKVEQKDFYDLTAHAAKVEMLQGEQVADFFEDEKMYALRLFYETGDYVSLFMPKDANNFENFVEEFSVAQLKPAFEKKKVEIMLPKVEIEYQSAMIKEIYKTFGVQKIFEKGNYDFAKMISFDIEASVKNVLLKAKMKFDEGLSPNFAKRLTLKASKIIASEKSSDSNQKEEGETLKNLEKAVFNADHPFIFMINNGDFIGIVSKVD